MDHLNLALALIVLIGLILLIVPPIALTQRRRRMRPASPGVYSRSAAVSAIAGLPVSITVLIAALQTENDVDTTLATALALCLWIFILIVAARGIRSVPTQTSAPLPAEGTPPPGGGPTTLEILAQVAGILSLVVAIIALVVD